MSRKQEMMHIQYCTGSENRNIQVTKVTTTSESSHNYSSTLQNNSRGNLKFFGLTIIILVGEARQEERE